MCELTRAANYVCDNIRQYISHSYRLKEGCLLAQSGPYGDFSFRMHRLEYKGEERIRMPYPRLEKFKKLRETRDLNFGKGVSADDAGTKPDDNIG